MCVYGNQKRGEMILLFTMALSAFEGRVSYIEYETKKEKICLEIIDNKWEKVKCKNTEKYTCALIDNSKQCYKIIFNSEDK